MALVQLITYKFKELVVIYNHGSQKPIDKKNWYYTTDNTTGSLSVLICGKLQVHSLRLFLGKSETDG